MSGDRYDDCEQCHTAHPLRHLSVVELYDGVEGWWEGLMCPRCLRHAEADPGTFLVRFSSVLRGRLGSTIRNVGPGRLTFFPEKAEGTELARPAPSGHTPDSAGGDHDWSHGNPD